ncbi:MAG TPA: DUF3131 domain-containing protein [Candidatus Thiothrix moscowensis]|uniref:DUF3131 domain-containing protein n=1 Tax=unclassified Thiothrix TaxID=2636184 RepID=UPI0025ECD3F0|nr:MULTISPECIES: DUF3131 domain-containing protein [unclassified Thiothrix]HRJ51730.1 DUF3131 domain-containing protein [Candidatus Thiothrix moscowensis]HRJ92045.1 DUF3131 domain-containing protein [Candidatus Thiothrix moscowensis]
MSFKQNLVRARSHIIFLTGLVTAFGLVGWLEGISMGSANTPEAVIETSSDVKIAPTRPLTAQEMEWAKTAWKYFQNNTVTETGLVNSADKYPASTLWDTSSYLMAVIAAQRLGIIDQTEFDARIFKALDSLAKLPLFEGKLPNKSYNTISLQMVDYNNQPSEQGIGWSAIDIGRVLVPFNILAWNYPQHTQSVKQVLASWDTNPMLLAGTMHGAAVDSKGKTAYPQEGRLGYEEYAAKSFNLMGADVSSALRYTDFLKFVDIEGIQVATDSRDPLQYGAHNYVVSEPYILDGIEFGWDHLSQELAWRVYKAQEKRFASTGILTAVSEDNIDQPPHFVYNTVFTSGKAWNAITEKGEDASQFKTLSSKAVIGWHMLYETDYTQKLMEKAASLADPQRGWYSGLYEVTGLPNKILTANTNGIILEALAYKQTGQLMKLGR